MNLLLNFIVEQTYCSKHFIRYKVNNISTFTVHVTFNLIYLTCDCTFKTSAKIDATFLQLVMELFYCS